MSRALVRPALLMLMVAIAGAVAAWPTAYRLGWGNAMLGKEVAAIGQEVPAIGSFVTENAAVWWIAANSHPPGSVVEWAMVVGLSAFAALALLIITAKAVVLALAAAFALGAAVGAVRPRDSTSSRSLTPLLRLIRLMRLQVRFWFAEFLLVMAGIVALEAAALALRVHS